MSSFSTAALFASHVGGARVMARDLARDMTVTDATTTRELITRLPGFADRANVIGGTWLAGATRSARSSMELSITHQARVQADLALESLRSLLDSPARGGYSGSLADTVDAARRRIVRAADLLDPIAPAPADANHVRVIPASVPADRNHARVMKVPTLPAPLS